MAVTVEVLTGGFRLSQPHLLDMLLPASIPAPRDFARRRFQRRWMALIDRIIDARLASFEDGAPRDLFDLLPAARDPETGAAFTREQLRDQVATMIVAGHETTAVTLFWSLYLLAHAPDRRSRPRTRGRPRRARFAGSDPCRSQRGAATLSARVYDDAGRDRLRPCRRSRDSARTPC